MKVTLCGSAAFRDEIDRIAAELAKTHEVEIPSLRAKEDQIDRDPKMSLSNIIDELGGIDNVPLNHSVWTDKSNAIDDHFAKIAWSDAILVVNHEKRGIDGYVGGNTLMEIAVAYFLKKRIFLLMPMSAKLSYKEEILAVHPVILNNDLSLVV